MRQVASASYDTRTTTTLTVGTFSTPFHVFTRTNPSSSTAPQVAGAMSVSAGLRSDGLVYVWGFSNNAYPTVVPGISGVVKISMGGACCSGVYHVLALRSDGTVWAWGNNNANGQMGDGTTNTHSTPVQVVGLSGVIDIAAGETHSMAVRNDGTVWSWGTNAYGQLGDGTTSPSLPGHNQRTPKLFSRKL